MATEVIVLGTGGSGLTAAIAAHDKGAKVTVFEKHEQVGGTTAWSGGMIWIPNNHHESGLGVEDSRENALRYLKSLSHDMIAPEMAEAFLDAYTRVRPFSAAERRLLPAMLRAGALRFWLSRLWDLHLPRDAALLKPHDPTHFERVLRQRVCQAVGV